MVVKPQSDGLREAAATVTHAHAVAVINGVRRQGSQNEFLVHGREGSYLLQFADGFSGDFDPITITAHGGSLSADEGRLRSVLRGADASVTFDGEQLSISHASGTVSAAADFAIAKALSRRLQDIAKHDAGALAAVFAGISRQALASGFDRFTTTG